MIGVTSFSPRVATQAALTAVVMASVLIVQRPALADEYDWMLGVLNNNHIQDRFAARASGNVAVNAAAGSGNFQTNQRQINVGAGTASAPSVAISVSVPKQRGSMAMAADAEISGQAFAQGSGVLGVNQVSGAGNAQQNLVSVGGNAHRVQHGIRTAEPGVPVRSTNPSDQESGRAVGSIPNHYRAVIRDAAFGGFGGVLQINQVSGGGNVTANHFSISSTPGLAP